MTLKKVEENTVGKEENAGNQHFFFSFPTVFSTRSQGETVILAMFNLLSANTFNLVKSNILLFGKELTLSQTISGFYVSAVQVF